MSAAQDLLNDQQNFVTALQSASSTAIANAMLVSQFASDPIDVTPIEGSEPFKSEALPETPETQLIEQVEIGQIPEMSEALTVISEVYAGEAPAFDESPPEIDFGTIPSALQEFSAAIPVVYTNFDFPEVPAQLSQVFSIPSFSSITAPTKPSVSTPSFSAIAPTDATGAPKNLDSVFKANFSDTQQSMSAVAESQMDIFLDKINPEYKSQMARIEDQLSNYLTGGTGLSEEVETAIFNRGRERNDIEARRVESALLNEAASRGFTLPGGALMSMMARARQEAANNNNKTSNEIVIMQAEMEQKNLQFAVTTSAELRKSAVSAMLAFFQSSTALTGMAMEAAKNVVSAMVQTYEIEVRAFSVKLEAYKTEASVYDTKARVAGQVIDIYKAEIQAMEAMTNVDKSKVDLYRAQISTLKDYSDVYKAQVDAVVSKASLEKLKVDLFQGIVQSYSAQVQAKSAEWQGYQARLAGEESKVKIFSAQASVFREQIEAYKALHSAASEKIRAEAARNNSITQELTAKIGAYEAGIRAKVAVASGNMDVVRQHYAAHKSVLDFAVATEHTKLEAYKANNEVTLANARFNIDGEILKVYSGPASAAAAGMNSLASVSYQE